METICDPPVPYLGKIPGRFSPGKIIRIQGTTPAAAYKFRICLQCGPKSIPRDDVALQVTVRTLEGCIAFNSLQNGEWGNEQREVLGLCAIKYADKFEIKLSCDSHQYKIAINEYLYYHFPYRIPYNGITHLAIDGDVSVVQISYTASSIDDVDAGSKTEASAPLALDSLETDNIDIEMVNDSHLTRPLLDPLPPTYEEAMDSSRRVSVPRAHAPYPTESAPYPIADPPYPTRNSSHPTIDFPYPTEDPLHTASSVCAPYPTGSALYPSQNPPYPTGNLSHSSSVSDPPYPIGNPLHPTKDASFSASSASFPISNPPYPTGNPLHPIKDTPYYTDSSSHPTRESKFRMRNPPYPTRNPSHPTRDSPFITESAPLPTANPPYPTGNPSHPTRDPPYPTGNLSHPTNPYSMEDLSYPTSDPPYPTENLLPETRQPSYPSRNTPYPLGDAPYPTGDTPYLTGEPSYTNGATCPPELPYPKSSPGRGFSVIPEIASQNGVLIMDPPRSRVLGIHPPSVRREDRPPQSDARLNVTSTENSASNNNTKYIIIIVIAIVVIIFMVMVGMSRM